MDAATIERQSSANAVTAQGHDEDRLAQFGYEQELRRDWGLAHNFGVSFSIISVITGITTLFSYGLNTGACQYLLLLFQEKKEKLLRCSLRSVGYVTYALAPSSGV